MNKKRRPMKKNPVSPLAGTKVFCVAISDNALPGEIPNGLLKSVIENPARIVGHGETIGVWREPENAFPDGHPAPIVEPRWRLWADTIDPASGLPTLLTNRGRHDFLASANLN